MKKPAVSRRLLDWIPRLGGLPARVLVAEQAHDACDKLEGVSTSHQ